MCWVLSSSVAAMSLLDAASLSSFVGYRLAHLHKFVRWYICRSCTRDIYVENYIKTRQYKVKPHTSTWTYILSTVDVYIFAIWRYILQFGHIYCVWIFKYNFSIFWAYLTSISKHTTVKINGLFNLTKKLFLSWRFLLETFCKVLNSCSYLA